VPRRAEPRRSLLAFFALTFLVSWTCFIGGAAIADEASPASTAVGYLVYLIGVFAPAFVAMALTYRAEGRAGVHALVSGIFRWPGQARWWIFAFSYMVVVRLTAAAIHRIALGAWPVFGREIWLVMIPATILSTPVQSGEEVGWRGDFLEAEAFAYLAMRSVKGLPLSVPSTTGVPYPLTGGVLHRP